MTAFIYLALVGLVTWYVWPAATTWKAKAMAFVLAFWLPISWPWLIWYGHRDRRRRRQHTEYLVQAQAQLERHQLVEWWLDQLQYGLAARDLQLAQFAHDNLDVLSITFERQRARYRELHADFVVMCNPQWNEPPTTHVHQS